MYSACTYACVLKLYIFWGVLSESAASVRRAGGFRGVFSFVRCGFSDAMIENSVEFRKCLFSVVRTGENNIFVVEIKSSVFEILIE